MTKFSKNVFALMCASVFAACTCTAAFAAGEIDAIKDRGYLKVGVKNDVVGFSFQDPLSGEYTGYEDTLAQMIADSLGVDVEFTAVTAATRGELVDSGDLDIAIATFTITPERVKHWDFSIPYYTDYVSVLVENSSNIKTLADLKDKKVGVSSGSTSAMALTRAMIEAGIIDSTGFDEKTFNPSTWTQGISYQQYDNYPTISTALSAGEIQAFCVDKSILNIYQTKNRSFVSDARFSPQEYGTVTKKGSDLSGYVNDLIKGWKEDGTLDKLIKENHLD
ncbi:MAG: transporter substrate-binding domain-containing protein [Proteobacteria bacterium]|uniref:Transporter substrate-binding domain-containing protein n=1 Tax=Candidatus Avisuccinivibrio stercorigallinarum TaxID=2840704 RepID=A0A9D9GSN5_9GAMM|nr:transporter substrate-binding domain-containing protein [Candidatus Avisuccinivibrio stercorigallinarum]